MSLQNIAIFHKKKTKMTRISCKMLHFLNKKLRVEKPLQIATVLNFCESSFMCAIQVKPVRVCVSQKTFIK